MKKKYVYSGMYIGMLMGLIIGNTFQIEYGCMVIGILLGGSIGIVIDYKKYDKEKKENRRTS